MTDPIEAFVAATRAGLLQAGLERVEREGSVYFRSPQEGAAVPPSRRPVLVLLHGVNDQAGTWAPVAASLAARCRLIVPDLAGHGESAPKSGPLPLPLILDRLHTIIVNETSGPVALLGNSMGGWVAMLYTFAHPECASRLVLEDASGMAWVITVPLFPQTKEQAVLALHAVNGPKSDTPDWAIETMLSRSTVAPMTRVAETGVLEFLVDARLGEIKVPVTLIWGADDGLLPVTYAEVLQKRIAGSTLCVIEGAAHIPHRQQPEKFLACLNTIF